MNKEHIIKRICSFLKKTKKVIDNNFIKCYINNVLKKQSNFLKIKSVKFVKIG